MTEEEKFIESLYIYGENEIKAVYKEEKKYRDELLNVIALTLLSCTILGDIMALNKQEIAKQYKIFYKIVKLNTGQNMKFKRHTIENILLTISKDVKEFYKGNLKMEELKQIIQKEFKGKHFYIRILDNEEKTARNLLKQIKGFLNGEISVNDIEKNIKDIFNNNAYETKRLLEAETSRVEFETFLNSCKDRTKEYRYNSVLEATTCKECSGNHGKILTINNIIPLPRHPFCKCFYEEV